MGYDQPERSSSSGAIVAVLVAVLLILVIGGLFVVGGGYLWMRTARVQQQAAFAERDAQMQAERARAMVEQARVEMEAQRRLAEAIAQKQQEAAATDASVSRPDLTVNVDKEGGLSINGDPIDLGELRERLAKHRDQTGRAVSVSLSVHPDCPAGYLQPVLTACVEVGHPSIRVATADESEPSGETEVRE